MYIIRPDIPEGEYDQVLKRYEQAVVENGGRVMGMEEWGSRSFAYEIEHYDKGYYVLMAFVLDPVKLPMLKERFQLDERVLRFQIVRQEERVPSQIIA